MTYLVENKQVDLEKNTSEFIFRHIHCLEPG